MGVESRPGRHFVQDQNSLAMTSALDRFIVEKLKRRFERVVEAKPGLQTTCARLFLHVLHIINTLTLVSIAHQAGAKPPSLQGAKIQHVLPPLVFSNDEQIFKRD